MGHVEAHEGLVELEAVINGGNPGVCDGEAGDVGVEGDGHHVQRPGQAHHAQAAGTNISPTFWNKLLNGTITQLTNNKN